MLDDENADEKSGGERRHWQRDPKRYGQAQVHCGAGGEKPAERRRELSEAARQYRRLKSLSSRKYLVHLRQLPHPPPAEMNPPAKRFTHRHRPAAAGTDITLIGRG